MDLFLPVQLLFIVEEKVSIFYLVKPQMIDVVKIKLRNV